MKLTQFNLKRKTKYSTHLPISINKNAEWLPIYALFSDDIWRYTHHTSRPLSKLHELCNSDSFNGYRKYCSRTRMDLFISPHMWAEHIDKNNLKVLWSLVIHKDYLKKQIGSLLTCRKLIPEYTQLHIRSEFSYYKYKSPTLRKNFIKNILKKAEEEEIKIYERNDFKDMFLNFTDHIDTLKELKQVKQKIINGLQKTEQRDTQERSI